MYISHKFDDVEHAPYDPVAAQAALGDTPVFPGAVQDAAESKGMRITTLTEAQLVQADKVDAVAYRIDTEYVRILGWFSDEMQKRGFKIVAVNGGNAYFVYSKTVIILQPFLNRRTNTLLGYSVTRIQGARKFDLNRLAAQSTP